jgi:hypothetical protein
MAGSAAAFATTASVRFVVVIPFEIFQYEHDYTDARR